MEDLVEEWMKTRIEQNLPFLTGTVMTGNLIYAWANTQSGPQSNRESSTIFVGNVNPIYNKELSDQDVLEILRDLAFFLGEKLCQTRVYLTYNGDIYIFQDDRKSHPTQ